MIMASRRYWYPLMWAGTPTSWMMAVTWVSRLGPLSRSASTPPGDITCLIRSHTEEKRQGFVI